MASKAPTRARVRLVRVKIEDFRCSDRTLYERLPKSQKSKLRGIDAVCFMNNALTQALFVYGFYRIGITKFRGSGVPFGMLTSVRLRMTAKSFSLSSLNMAAKETGIEIVNAALLDEWWNGTAFEVAA